MSRRIKNGPKAVIMAIIIASAINGANFYLRHHGSATRPSAVTQTYDPNDVLRIFAGLAL